MKNKIRIFRIIRFILFISIAVPSALFAQMPNGPVTYTLETLRTNYPAEYLVRYRIGGARVLDIGLTNFDFSQVSILLTAEPSREGETAVRVRSFEISNFTVPSLPLWTVTGAVTDTVMTPEVPVAQTPVPITVSNIAPMEDIFSIGDPTIWIIVLAVLTVLGTGAFVLYRFLTGKKAAPPAQKGVDPYEEALKSLNRLKQTRMTGKNYKEIYLGIWETVRRFLERVFAFRAMEMSTSEIVSHFNRAAGEGPSDGALDEIHDIAIHLLKTCDRVKYAKFETSAEQSDVILNDSFDMVRRTREYFDRLNAQKAAEEKADNGGNKK